MADIIYASPSFPRLEYSGVQSGIRTHWLLIALFVAANAPGLVGAPALERYFFLASSVLVAAYLFFKDKIVYVSFCWWLYFLSPLVRRVADYRAGFLDPNPVLLAPILASGVCVIALFQSRDIWTAKAHGFLLPLLGLGYAFVVSGLAHSAPVSKIVKSAIAWTVPVIFGFFIAQCAPMLPRLRASLIQTFAWGLTVMGAYGVYQFIFAPVWDCYWMEQATDGPFGKPEPLLIRVFSTMNSHQPLALTLLFGIFLLLGVKTFWSRLACGAAFVDILLSCSRGAWLGWVIGLLLFGYLTRRLFSFGTVVKATAVVTLALAGLYFSPMWDQLSARVSSFAAGTRDDSYIERQQGHMALLTMSSEEPLGMGFGGVEHRLEKFSGTFSGNDSTLLPLLLDAGWLGAALYFIGVGMLVVQAYQGSRISSDVFPKAVFMMCVVFTFESTLTGMMAGPGAIVWWTSLGLAAAVRETVSADSPAVTLSAS